MTADNETYYGPLNSFLAELRTESPRGIAIVAAAVIEDKLGAILKASFQSKEIGRKLVDDPRGPLATFSARADLTFALGHISEREYREIDIIRRIRNEFAHNLRASFESARLRDLSANLTMCVPGNVSPQSRVSTAAASLLVGLYNRDHTAQATKRDGG
jgi:mannitol operon repressor